MYRRNLAPKILAALSDTPIVLLHGARQTGKTTLVQEIASQAHPARYLTFDEAAVLAAAKADPTGFIAGLDGPVVLDEVQRVPELFPAIKASVDRNRQPGRFLLTGSANVLLVPKVSESLAGRIEIIPLWPLSQGEIAGVTEGFVDAVFAARLPKKWVSKQDSRDLIARAMAGGYPEALARKTTARRNAWFGSYITAILQRDVRDMANIEGLSAFPRLLSLLASRVGSLLNFSDFSRGLSLPGTTLKRYFALLEATFLVHTLPAWSTKLGQRLVKSPKLYLNDTGLLAHLLGITAARLTHDANLTGPLLENFVVAELLKQVTWSEARPRLFHFRTTTGGEVDVVLENAAGELVGIEVKAGATVGKNDFRGLEMLSEAAAKKFIRGLILYTGTELVPFAENLHAVPIGNLWTAVH
jgi:predicted AAA+ superfamily ATPase